MPVLTVATYNPHHSRPTDEIRIDVLKLISAGADIICLQEMQGHYSAVYPLVRKWGSHYIEQRGSEITGKADCPILYNAEKVTLQRAGYREVSEPQPVEPGAGGNDVSRKTVNWVVITVGESRKPVAILNVHAIASVERHGKPDEGVPKRLAVYAQLMQTLRAVAKRRMKLGQAVIVAGDLNVDYDRDEALRDARFPYSVFESIGIHASYAELGSVAGTHGGRAIDYVCGSTRIRTLSQQVLEGYGSDHKPLLVTFEIPS